MELYNKKINGDNVAAEEYSSLTKESSPADCIGCKKCITAKNGCPVEAISFGEDGKVVINQETCVGCGICKSRCNFDAIKIKQTMPMRSDLHEYFMKDYNMDLKIWEDEK